MYKYGFVALKNNFILSNRFRRAHQGQISMRRVKNYKNSAKEKEIWPEKNLLKWSKNWKRMYSSAQKKNFLIIN